MYQKSNSYDPMNEYTYWVYTQMLKAKKLEQINQVRDFGPSPFIVNIEDITEDNEYFRRVYWTNDHMQLAVMSINVGEDIGLEMHPENDQFIRFEDGEGLVMIGDSRDNLNHQANVSDGVAVIVPAGWWHNIINVGNTPLKLYTIYAPSHHPAGTVHRTKEEAMKE